MQDISPISGLNILLFNSKKYILLFCLQKWQADFQFYLPLPIFTCIWPELGTFAHAWLYKLMENIDTYDDMINCNFSRDAEPQRFG